MSRWPSRPQRCGPPPHRVPAVLVVFALAGVTVATWLWMLTEYRTP